MKYLFFTLILFSSLSVSAQEKRYFNRGFQKQYSSHTNYKREYTVSKDSIITKDYIRGKLDSEGVFYGFDSLNNVDAFFKYYRNRRYNKPKNLILKNRKALVTLYKNAKTVDKKLLYQNDTVYYRQVWNKKGEAVLIDGNGRYEFTYSKGTEKFIRQYQDSLLVLDIGIRLDKNDTIYYQTDKAAYPKEGISKFHRKLSGYLKYPKKAQERGLEAKILVQFIVDIDGKLTDFRAITNYGHNFEAATISRLLQLTPWSPAIFNDKPVKTQFILPITFRLN